MKILCEVCDKEEAIVFCPADEAALCGVCDRNVHNANKLATKHCRFALLQPDESHLCDICQVTPPPSHFLFDIYNPDLK